MDSMIMMKPGVLVNTALLKTVTPSNIISGFRRTEISLYDNCIFQEDDFASSYATERPNPFNRKL